jgi:hypothetical protein
VLPRRVVGDGVGEAVTVRRVGESCGTQPPDHLERHHERLGGVGHAARHGDLPDQRPLVEARGELLLQPGPGLAIGGSPEAADDALFAVEHRRDRRTLKALRPVRGRPAAPHPELHGERLLRIALVVGTNVGQRPVDDVVGADLGVGRGLQLLPARDHDEAAKNAGLGVERLQRIDSAVSDEAIRAHRDQPADRSLVLGNRRIGRQQEQASAGEARKEQAETLQAPYSGARSRIACSVLAPCASGGGAWPVSAMRRRCASSQ